MLWYEKFHYIGLFLTSIEFQYRFEFLILKYQLIPKIFHISVHMDSELTFGLFLIQILWVIRPKKEAEIKLDKLRGRLAAD